MREREREESTPFPSSGHKDLLYKATLVQRAANACVHKRVVYPL
ncbi:MAG: hypothetical protein FD149_738 [Rhodospirillaceae bacterium]|nr:MAG: hypothetical protein FD149_738 [Rhodospirillaceae bacterium]